MSSTAAVDDLLGNPRRALLTMSIPLLFALLIENLQTFIDRMWCSGLGSAELSAISISLPLYSMIAAVGTGIGIGASAAIARFIGAGDKDSARRSASDTIVIALASSFVVVALMLVIAEPLIRISGGGANVGLCMDYTLPFIICSFFLMMNGVWAGLLRAEGAAKFSMILSASASLINIVLDPVFIYGLGLGLKGASIATCIAYIAMTAIAATWYASGKTFIRLSIPNLRSDKHLIKEIAIVGVPCVIELFLMPLLIIPENALVVACGGTDGLTIYATAFQVITIALLPSTAIAKSLVPILSAASGQRNYGKIIECIKLSFKYIVLIESILAIVVLIFANYLDSLFINSASMEPLRDEMVLATRIFTIACIVNSVRIIGTSVLQALRHAGLSTIITVSRELMFIAAFAIAGTISMVAIYWSLDIVNLITMAVTWMCVFYGLKKVRKELNVAQRT